MAETNKRMNKIVPEDNKEKDTATIENTTELFLCRKMQSAHCVCLNWFRFSLHIVLLVSTSSGTTFLVFIVNFHFLNFGPLSWSLSLFYHIPFPWIRCCKHTSFLDGSFLIMMVLITRINSWSSVVHSKASLFCPDLALRQAYL